MYICIGGRENFSRTGRNEQIFGWLGGLTHTPPPPPPVVKTFCIYGWMQTLTYQDSLFNHFYTLQQTINTSLNMNVLYSPHYKYIYIYIYEKVQDQGCKIVANNHKGIIFLKLFNIDVIKLFFIEIYRELKKTIKDTNL